MDMQTEYNNMSIEQRETWFLSCNYRFTDSYANMMSPLSWNNLPAYIQRVLTEYYKNI